MDFKKHIFSKCLLVLLTALYCGGDLYANEVLLDEIDCGELNVGQSKYITFEVANHENVPLVIESLGACCGNPKPTISSMTIPVGGKVELVQIVKKIKPGPFTITSQIFLKGFDDKTLSFRIKGEAKQYISTMVGWSKATLTKVDYYADITRLEPINQKGEKLILTLSATKEHFLSEESISSVESRYFSKPKSIPKDCRVRNDNDEPTCRKTITDGNIASQMVDSFALYLEPNLPFPIGELFDKIIVVFKDGTECHIPIAFRVVGDIYGEALSINIGKIPLTGTVQKNFKVNFTNGVSPWTQVKWRTDGKLAEAINIFPGEQKISGNALNLIIEINGGNLLSSERGFISSVIYLTDNERNNKGIKLIIYGYR